MLWTTTMMAQPHEGSVVKVASSEQLIDAIKLINQSPQNEWTLQIEAGVYWLDNPDATEVRKSEGGTPFAQTIRCKSIRLIGSDPNAANTVLAVNRGQTQGAIGNFTMFLFQCKNIYAENITFGNYCNVDLNYPLRPELSRKKRAEAIVQAQLAICSGTDSVVCKNCNFISRLNLCNFTGARNALFERCHLECTDDALAEGTYKNCHLTFYSSKPFYSTSRGAWFEDCDIDIKTKGTQYFTKVPGPIHLKNVRLHSAEKIKLAWCKDNHPEICSAENVTLNGKKAKIDDKPTKPIKQIRETVDYKQEAGGYVYIFDAYKPSDTEAYSWKPDNSKPAWYWGTAPDGAEGYKGLVQSQRGARMLITPKTEGKAITSATIEAIPCKSAGQGFGSATGQYMDICVSFDPQKLTGYGLRIERTPDYDHAVVVRLVEYSNGTTSPITPPAKCELFKTPCKISVGIETSKSGESQLTAILKHGKATQKLEKKIAHPSGSSFMLQHTGTTGGGATLLKSIKVK